jgi:uncharacterized integral membrane protein
MMRIRLGLTLLLLVPLLLLAAINRAALLEPVTVELLVTQAEWPLWPAVVLLPLLLSGIYLLAALFDRARHLRQVVALERQLETARRDLDRGREAALDALAERFEARIEGLEASLEGSVSGMEQRLVTRVDGVDAHVGRVELEQREALEGLTARVKVVREQLVADVAEAQDALLRGIAPQLGSGREDALVVPGHAKPRDP